MLRFETTISQVWCQSAGLQPDLRDVVLVSVVRQVEGLFESWLSEVFA